MGARWMMPYAHEEKFQHTNTKISVELICILGCQGETSMQCGICYVPYTPYPVRVQKKVPLMRYPSRAYILGCQRPQCAILNAKQTRRTNRQNFFPVKDDLTVMHSAPSPISISCLRYLVCAKLAVMRNMEKVATFKWPIDM